MMTCCSEAKCMPDEGKPFTFSILSLPVVLARMHFVMGVNVGYVLVKAEMRELMAASC